MKSASDCARASVEVFVAAPGGEVGVDVVEVHGDVAHSVGEIPATECAGVVSGFGDARHVEELAGEIVDGAEHNEGEFGGVGADGF